MSMIRWKNFGDERVALGENIETPILKPLDVKIEFPLCL